MAEYYNKKPHTICFTGADGGRMSLPPVDPGKKPKTVSGDYYKSLVKRGLLAEWTPEVADMYRKEYLKKVIPRRLMPKKAPVPQVKKAPKPDPVVEEVIEDLKVGQSYTAEELEKHTIAELKAFVELNDMEELPKEITKKADIISYIVENME